MDERDFRELNLFAQVTAYSAVLNAVLLAGGKISPSSEGTLQTNPLFSSSSLHQDLREELARRLQESPEPFHEYQPEAFRSAGNEIFAKTFETLSDQVLEAFAPKSN